MIKRPMRPLPSLNGWIRSKATWNDSTSSRSCLPARSYPRSRASISASTFSGGVVGRSSAPTTFSYLL